MRDSYHHGDLARALVDEAVRMIEAEGARSFSLRGCARALGVDVAAVYRHFASKEVLVSAACDHGSAELMRRMEESIAVLPVRSPEAVFIAIGRGYVRFAVERPLLYDVMFSQRARGNSDGGRIGVDSPGRTSSAAWQLLNACLDELLESGSIDPGARDGADLTAWATVHGLATLINRGAIEASGEARERTIERSCRTVLAGLRHLPRRG